DFHVTGVQTCALPISSCNGYYALPALLLAGLDGIKNKIDPGDPFDIDLYDIKVDAPTAPGSLHAVLEALECDHDFLLQGGVFTQDIIDTYIDYKRVNEADQVSMRPHPYEFRMYFDI